MKLLTPQTVQNLCIQTARKLVTLPNLNSTFSQINKDKTKMIFPSYTSQVVRISEQEAKLCFCHVLEKTTNDIYYSVETPTESTYSFKDKILDDGKMSARSDLSLYLIKNKKIVKYINCEFKHTNTTKKSIVKDFIKLNKEPYSGLFFHVLDSANSGTLSNTIHTGVFDKYKIGFEHKVSNWVDAKNQDEKFIVFAIYIVKQKLLLLKTFTQKGLKDLNKFFILEYKPTRNIIVVTKANNWRVIDL
jgi:hypothetical protein